MQNIMQNLSIVEFAIIGLLVYIIGFPYILILSSLLNIIFNADKYSLLFFINSLAIYAFGYYITIFSNLIVSCYYICYNYDTIIKYHKMLKELHNISKVTVDDKFKTEEYQTLTVLVEKADQIKIYIDTINDINNMVREYLLKKIDLISKSIFGQCIIMTRSYLNLIGNNILLTIKYILQHIYISEFIEKQQNKYMRYYKYISDNSFDIQKDKPEDIILDEDFNNLPIFEDIQTLSQMSDIMQNFSNLVMKTGGLNMDRKTKRFINKINKKNSKKR